MKLLRHALLSMLLVLISCSVKNRPVVTFVTALVDIDNDKIHQSINDASQHQPFKKLLGNPANLIIFGQKYLQDLVKVSRPQNRTLFIQINKSNFSESWQVSLLQRSFAKFPQSRKRSNIFSQIYKNIFIYSPLTLKKIPWVHYAMKNDPFHSDFYSWIDAGIHNQFSLKYQPQNPYENFQLFSQQSFNFHKTVWRTQNIKSKYAAFSDFQQQRQNTQRIKKSDYILGGYFGGRAQAWPTLASIYQNYLRVALQAGLLTFEEEILTLMRYRYPYLLTTVTNLISKAYFIQYQAKTKVEVRQQRRWSASLPKEARRLAALTGQIYEDYQIQDWKFLLYGQQIQFYKSQRLKIVSFLLVKIVFILLLHVLIRKMKFKLKTKKVKQTHSQTR